MPVLDGEGLEIDPLATAMGQAAHAAPPTQQSEAWAQQLWHTYANIAAAVHGKLDGGVDAMVAAQQGGLNQVLVLTAGVLLAYQLARTMMIGEGNPVSLLLLTAVRFAVILSAAIGSYNEFIAGNLRQLPTQIGNGLIGAIGGAPFQGAAAFDNAFNSLWAAAAICYENGPDDYKIIIFGIALVVSIFVGGIMILAAFIVWLAADVTLQLGIALGPMFIAAALVPATKGLTDGWIATVLSAIAAQILVLMILGLVGFAEDQTTNQIIAAKAAPGGNVMVQLQGIIEFTIGMAVLGILAYTQVPALAARLMSGVHLHVGGYTATLFGAGSAAWGMASYAASGAERLGGAVGGALRGGGSSSGGGGGWQLGNWAGPNIGRSR